MSTRYLEAEFGSIGLILNNPQMMDVFASEIGPEDFSDEKCRKAFTLMLKSYHDGLPICFESLCLWGMENDKELGLFVVDALTFGPRTLSEHFFINAIKALRWKKRALVGVSGARDEIASVATVSDALDVSRKIENLANDLAVPSELRDKIPSKGASLIFDAMLKFDERATRKAIFKTGLTELDELIGGWQPANYYVLGAVTGHGKTLFGTNFANAAVNQGKHTLYATIEMEKHQIVDRIVCTRAKIPTNRMTKGLLSAKELDAVKREYEALSQLPLSVSHLSNASFEEFETDCRRLKKAGELDFVVLDYLQDLKISKANFRNQFEAISAVTTHCRNLSHALKIPIVALAQLNRDAQHEDLPPKKSQLRGSGQIENDADGIFLIHHEFEKLSVGRKINNSWLIVDKNRHGPETRISVSVDFETNRVTDYASFN